MSEIPHQQAGSVPVTMTNIAGWNQTPHLHPQGQAITTGTPQSVVHGMLPQSQSQSSNQQCASPPKTMKFQNVTHNGAGHTPSNVISPNSQASLSDNLRQNFHMFVSQNQKSSNLNSSISPNSTPSGSLDLSHSSPANQSKSVTPPDHQVSREPSSVSQAPSVISRATMSGQFNGDVQARSSAVVSVIANALSSPSKIGSSSAIQSSTVSANQTQDSNTGVVAEGLVIKQEPRTGKESSVSPEKEFSKSELGLEPPLKKMKQESVSYVNNTVIVGSSEVSGPDTKTPQQTTAMMSHANQHPAPVSNSSKQDVMDVESQLEALFAGIADDGNSSKESKAVVEKTPASAQGTTNVVAVLESRGSSSKKAKGKANGVKSHDVAGTSSADSTPRKKRKKKPAKPWEDEKNKKGKKSSTSKGKYVKEASCDSGSNASSSRVRGPVVHIEGSKDAPTSLAVVNAPSRQDDEDNDSKKKSINSGRVRKSHIIESKVSSAGLCSNSLVSRYEAHSSDPRWVCIFCKKGCHVEDLGDLFGPYLVNHDKELENSLDLDAEMNSKAGDKKDKKMKRSGIGQTGVLGLLGIPPLAGEQNQYMVYFHENCAVWSPTVNLIGSRLIGVQEAVWVAVRSKCSRCHLDGANIGCVHHGCSCQVHFPCARDAGWIINGDTFISACDVHKKLHGAPLLPSTTS